MNEGIFVTSESERMLDEDPNYDKKLNLLGRAKTVKFLSILDVLFSIYYAVFVNWACIFLAILSLSGYHGGKTFKKNYILTYIFSIFIYIILKIVFITMSNSHAMIFFSLISLLSEIYLLYTVGKFYYLLKDVSGQVLHALQTGWTPRIIPFVYY